MMTEYADYRHDATRKNNPSAAFASQGRVNEMPRKRYAYDPHLPPTLRFDDSGESDRVRELVDEATRRRLTESEAQTLADALANRQPWLEWTGKREKRWFEVDPVALHTHERVSALAAIKIAARQDAQRGLWADPEQSYHEAVQFYKHEVPWANRLILGDSLAAMNSLSVREDLAGKVQMIYVDPPYGINYRSNFQPLIDKSGVGKSDTDANLTREPEVVKAYRDTWNLGIHTYLAYLRDRLTVARDLLADSGSIFVQISDENIHRVRSIMDEVFGYDNFISVINFRKTVSQTTKLLSTNSDSLLWYAKDKSAVKYNRLRIPRDLSDTFNSKFQWIELPNGEEKRFSPADADELAQGEIFAKDGMDSQTGSESSRFPVEFRNVRQTPSGNRGWSTSQDGITRLMKSNRLTTSARSILYKRYFSDYPFTDFTNNWHDTMNSFEKKPYVVQTNTIVIERCMLMTTEPGDLVLDPTCGGGTTAYIAEEWGRRWITIDTSRVSIALTRQRLLTAKFDYYETASDDGTINGGFEYATASRISKQTITQNVALDPIFAKWDAVLDEKLAALNSALSDVDAETRAALRAKLGSRGGGGRNARVSDSDERRWKLPQDGWEHWQVPFDSDPLYPPALAEALSDYRSAWRGKMAEVNASIAAAADQEVLVDQPKIRRGVTRVSGPFTVESVHPVEDSLGEESPIGGAPDGLESGGFAVGGDDSANEGAFAGDDSNAGAFADSLTRLLRGDGVRFPGNAVKPCISLERMSDGGALHADGEWENGDPDNPMRVAVSFGPQYGPVTANQVEDAIRTANRRGYDALVFAGFAFDGAAQSAIEADSHPNVRVHIAHISPDVNMGDLLKNAKDSQLFTVSGAPRASVSQTDGGEFVVEMEGVDIYDPVKNVILSESAAGVAAWLLDGDYDGRTFCASQVFFPNSDSWEPLSKALKGVVDADAFAAFSGVRSLPFPAGANRRAAIKVIDPRGNEVMRTFDLGGSTYG